MPGEVERGRVVKHDIDDGGMKFQYHPVGVDLGKVPRHHDIGGAVVAAKLLYIHGDEYLVLQNQNSHAGQ
jgi:hypothetical protein